MHHHALLKNFFEVKTFVGNLNISGGFVAQKTKFQSLKRILPSMVVPVSGGKNIWCSGMYQHGQHRREDGRRISQIIENLLQVHTSLKTNPCWYPKVLKDFLAYFGVYIYHIIGFLVIQNLRRVLSRFCPLLY